MPSLPGSRPPAIITPDESAGLEPMQGSADSATLRPLLSTTRPIDNGRHRDCRGRPRRPPEAPRPRRGRQRAGGQTANGAGLRIRRSASATPRPPRAQQPAARAEPHRDIEHVAGVTSRARPVHEQLIGPGRGWTAHRTGQGQDLDIAGQSGIDGQQGPATIERLDDYHQAHQPGDEAVSAREAPRLGRVAGRVSRPGPRQPGPPAPRADDDEADRGRRHHWRSPLPVRHHRRRAPRRGRRRRCPAPARTRRTRRRQPGHVRARRPLRRPSAVQRRVPITATHRRSKQERSPRQNRTPGGSGSARKAAG